MAGLGSVITEETKWGLTANGADTLVTTSSKCLDMFGRAGSMRDALAIEKRNVFSDAFNENAEIATKLLFYVRDARGGYGEKSTFEQMIKALADISPKTVVKNLWAILEFGRAKDLYFLIDTPVEGDMWQFMKSQFNLDLENMAKGKSISLLAKWIATPDCSSARTAELGKLTAKKLGYSYKTMREYKTKLRALRKYLDLPEAKMCAGKWNEIEYSKCASRFILKNRNAIMRNDSERWVEYLVSVQNGNCKMNMSTNTPYDLIMEAQHRYSNDIEVMWSQLPDVCTGNALVMCDTSGSMCSGKKVRPIDVALALTIYLSERNKGDLKNKFLTFETTPKFQEIRGATLADKCENIKRASWNGSTNLEAAFDLLLDTCVKYGVKADEMPDALVVISDMQINFIGDEVTTRMTFFDTMKERYKEQGYKMPHIIFWNVKAEVPTFHAASSDKGASLVSGYSANIYKYAMKSIGMTPYQLMMDVIGSERYKDITV